jgi:hypothetical protein
MGFTKLFDSIITSTVWCEDDPTVRVWIRMLALANANGVVEGSIPGLASVCRVTVEACQKAVDLFSSPDPYSRNPDHEGRRIEPHPGGWKLLNYLNYRDRGQDKDGSRADYMRQYRSKQQNITRNNELLRVTQKQKQNKRSGDDPTEPDHSHKEFLSFFCDSFSRKFGKKYTVNGGKEGMLIKIALKVHSLATLQNYVKRFFECKDEFIQKAGYTIGVFYSQINKLATEKKSKWAD